MRWGIKIPEPKVYKRYLITRFAWLPIMINGETRWLEKCYIWAYYWNSSTSNRKHWVYLEFAN